jgi:MscS family membrane protein
MATVFSSLRLYFFLVICFITLPNEATAQLLPETNAEATETPVVEEMPDSLNRRTPRGAVDGFFKAVADQNYTRASQYLNLKRAQRRTAERERLVKVLQNLLDQSGNIMPYSWISNKKTGRTDDELEQGTDLVGTVTINGEVVNLFVENTEDDDLPVWKFSTGTVAAIAAVKAEDARLIDKILPDLLKEKTLAGVPVGHWLAVVVIVAVAYLLAWGIVALVGFLIFSLWRRAKRENTAAVIHALNLPFRIYITVWLFVAISQQAGISIIVRQRFTSITLIIGLIAFLILLWRLSDFISTYTKNKMTLRGRISAISVILFLRRTAKVAIVVFGIIAILGTVGVDVTTWLAALGIGGIALALGAQKTMENFVGSVTLVTDQPVRVGDYCKVGDITGTVESIGMRSTKVRTGERTIVTIPNGDFSSSKIENYAHRDRFLFDPTFEFRPETTPDQIRFLLVEMRAILYAHPKVNPDPAKIRFTGFEKSAIKFEVWAYIEAANFDAFQEVQEDILLRMMDVVAQSGTSFATPSQTLYFFF